MTYDINLIRIAKYTRQLTSIQARIEKRAQMKRESLLKKAA